MPVSDIYTWCVQKRQPMPIWKNFFYLWTDIFVWVIFSLAAFVIVLVTYFTQQFEKLQPKWDVFRNLLLVFCFCCGFSSDYRPRLTSNRVLYGFCLCAYMIYAITMFSNTINFMRKPMFENQIKSMREIENSFELVGERHIVHHFKKSEVSSNVLIDCNQLLLSIWFLIYYFVMNFLRNTPSNHWIS